MKKANRVILYQGASRIDGNPIVAIATWNSKNTKTGDMVQTWIMRGDMKPNDALKTGQDASVCGDCILRPANRDARLEQGIKRGCYVKAHNAPRSVYEAFKRGVYGTDTTIVPNIKVRLGSYGDPCAVPIKIWRNLIALHEQDHTGYTHQWKQAKNRPYASLVQASVDNPMQALQAISKGFRLFYVDHKNHTGSELMVLPKMASCPASTEGGNRKTCASCLACNGKRSASDKRASMVIIEH